MLAVVAAVLVAARSRLPAVAEGAHLARLTVSGIITDDRPTVQAVDDLAGDNAVKALIVAIDSPGGSVAGGESLHDAIQRVAAKKPVVAVMRGTAASAGYMVAVPASRIFARQATITGSIGVLLETGEASGLLHMIGIDAEAITSGPLKDQPSFIRPLTPEGRDVLHGLVMDMYDQFVGMVAAGRHMDPATVRGLADGRAYTGRQALKLGLVDQIGGETEARAWLAADKGVSAGLPVTDIAKDRGLVARTFGSRFGGVLGGIWNVVFSQGVTLDRAWAVWQPSGGQ